MFIIVYILNNVVYNYYISIFFVLTLNINRKERISYIVLQYAKQYRFFYLHGKYRQYNFETIYCYFKIFFIIKLNNIILQFFYYKSNLIFINIQGGLTIASFNRVEKFL